MKTVTIFGSSVPKPGESDYQIAYEVGHELGKRGFDICTGGFFGIMEAASKGATDAGVEAIGITVPHFTGTPNAYVTKHIQCKTLFERITKLIEHGDAFVTLTDGTGTLLELSVVWEFMNKEIMQHKPAAVLGDFWIPLLNFMDLRMEFEGRETNVIKQFNHVSDCVEYITKSL